jgi:hypothetical protein
MDDQYSSISSDGTDAPAVTPSYTYDPGSPPDRFVNPPIPPVPPSVYETSDAAAKKWLAWQRQYGRACSLPPWDEFPWFENPSITYVTVGANSVVLLASANPRRVSLTLGLGTGNTVNLGPDPAMPNDPNHGIGIGSGGNLPLVIRQSEDGPLCQVAWYGNNPLGTPVIVTVIEVILRDWPR